MNTTTTVRSREVVQAGAPVGFDRFFAWWQDADPVRQKRRVAVFVGGLVLICGAAAMIGAVPTKIYGHDVFTGLDSGWRVMHGQRPHIDFDSAWGPVWLLAVALGLTISRHSVNGIAYANAIVALILGSWSYMLGKRRLASSPRILFSLFLAALVAAPYPLGIDFYTYSHAMVYNRYGYALLGIILLECVAPSRHGSKQEWIGGISTGAALSLTLFLKASFFFVGVVLIAATCIFLSRIGYRRVVGIIAGFCAISACLLAYLRFNVRAMLNNLRMAAGARAEGITIRNVLRHALAHASVLLGVVLFALATTLLCGARAPQLRRLRLLMIGALLFAGDIILMSSNAQTGGLPLCAIFGILIVNEITEEGQSTPASESRLRRPLYAGALFLGALLFVPQFTGDVASLACGVWEKWHPPSPEMTSRFTASDLQPLLLYDGQELRSNGNVFTTYVNDGVALLERETRPQETIFTMDMTNPFSYALQRQPAHGGIISPVYYYNLDDTHRPTDDRFFGDADIVMVPLHPSVSAENFRGLLEAYQPGLEQRYYLAARSQWWRLYRRR